VTVEIEIEIDDPSLVVLVGAAGAGKSTFAARHFAADEILSSDRFRAIVSGEEANQAATKAAFALLHRVLSRRLAERRLTVVDATSVQHGARRALIARANAARIPTIAIVLDLPPDTVIARNAARPARTVDMAVVRHQLAGVRSALDGPAPRIQREGFVRIVVLREPDEVDRVTIRRRRTPPTLPRLPTPEER
jgi:predicted kinase